MSGVTRRMTAGLLLAATVLGGCAQPSIQTASQEVEREAAAVFGRATLSENRAVFNEYDPDGKGFYLFRGFSEMPYPDVFTPMAPDSFERSFVVDYAVDIRDEKGFPIYRIGIRPRKISTEEVNFWPEFVTIDTAPRQGRPAKLVARLPQDRRLDRFGFFWSEETYCPDCFEMNRIKTSVYRKDESSVELVDRGLDAARSESGATFDYEGILRFKEFAGEGILEGANALRVAPMASAEVAIVRDALSNIAPAREAYMSFAMSYAKEFTPVNVMREDCNVYQAPKTPVTNPDEEKARVAGSVACMSRSIEKFDRSARAARISQLAEEEARLSQAGSIDAQNRIKIYTLDQEVAAGHALIRSTGQRFVEWHNSTPKVEMGVVQPPEMALSTEPVKQDEHEQDNYPIDQPEKSPVPPAVPQPEAVTLPPAMTIPSAAQEDVGEPLCPIAFLCP